MTFVSYAQNFEDVLLHRVFGGQETGFYVDVGAYDPVDGSVTKAFYDKGWTGINVEPGSVFVELAAARPGDVNLCMAIIDRPGEVAFCEDEADRGTSRVVMNESGDSAARMVPCDTLQAIVDAHSHGRPVDFVKVDAEGAESLIVHSTDWRRLRPRVLVLEATRPWSSMLANQDWEPVLLQQGYIRAYFDGINCFYIPEEEAPALLRHFEVPVNVLDRAERYGNEAARSELLARQSEAARLAAERDTLRATLDDRHIEVERLIAEQGRLQAAFDDGQAELARLTVSQAAERERLRATLDDRQAELARMMVLCDFERAAAARLTAERGALQAALQSQQAEAARLAVERDTLLAALQSQQAEADRLALERDAVRPALEANAPEAVETPDERIAPPSEAAGAPQLRRRRRRFPRLAAKAAYKLVRPVVRPTAWRLRTFMTGDLVGLLGRLDHSVEALARAPTHGQTVIAAEIIQPSVIQIRDDGAAAEMRRLAVEMERTLLTLALERVPEPWRLGPPDEAALPEPTRVALLLPHNRMMDVAFRPGDLSVAAVLAASGGDWEPHVRSYLESTVQSDWVCLDIGANLGAHTLSLAVLAQDGQVVAFEADAGNFALLSSNVAALTAPRAPIAPVNLALWDRPATLVFGGADELAGCSFVSEDLDSETVEHHLRTVVDAAAIGGIDLHIRSGSVAALPLDAWAEAHGLPRLDLIKLDVEGAEARVIRGADATLRRFRPILLVEYNPSCAAAYFGQPPEALYEELAARFAAIHTLEPDGTLTAVPNWTTLQTRLAAGKGWEDLVCLSAPSVAN
ncbi:FkbM family methyltransferase [Lichenicoccus sp.]|uniref:FkbM family methyltransferase n=1 Tax=Lichenicoccus sp. TaxID=2781899 RepID=UPI003D11D48B